MSSDQWKRRKLANRRKAEDRRKDIESAKKWMGLERRVADRRTSERRSSDEEPSENDTKQD